MLSPTRQEKTNRQLRRAIKSGDAALAKMLIAQGADVNAGAGEMGLLPIYAAIQSRDLVALEILLGAGASVFSPVFRTSSECGIHNLVRRDWPEGIQCLLKHVGPQAIVDWFVKEEVSTTSLASAAFSAADPTLFEILRPHFDARHVNSAWSAVAYASDRYAARMAPRLEGLPPPSDEDYLAQCFGRFASAARIAAAARIVGEAVEVHARCCPDDSSPADFLLKSLRRAPNPARFLGNLEALAPSLVPQLKTRPLPILEQLLLRDGDAIFKSVLSYLKMDCSPTCKFWHLEPDAPQVWLERALSQSCLWLARNALEAGADPRRAAPTSWYAGPADLPMMVAARQVSEAHMIEVVDLFEDFGVQVDWEDAQDPVVHRLAVRQMGVLGALQDRQRSRAHSAALEECVAEPKARRGPRL